MLYLRVPLCDAISNQNFYPCLLLHAASSWPHDSLPLVLTSESNLQIACVYMRVHVCPPPRLIITTDIK